MNIRCNMSKAWKTVAGGPVAFLLAGLLLAAGAGCYRVSGRYGSLPESVRSIAVPPVENRTTRFALERTLTPDLRRALARKSSVHVIPSAEGADAVLRVSIESLSFVATGVVSGGTGTAFEALGSLKVSLVETETGKVLFENAGLPFREPFIMPDVNTEFIPEEAPAMERLSVRLADEIASAVLEAF